MLKLSLRSSLVAASLAAASLGGAAYAAHHDRHGPDADGDRIVTRAEAQAHADQMFARMDSNTDGKLDAADRATHQAQKFAAADTNKDGALSPQEFAAGARHGPGPDGAGPDDAGSGGRMVGHGAGRHSGGMGGGMMMMQMADANQDQTVSKDEFVAAHLKHFDMGDTNKDARLTREERQAAHARMRGHAMPPPPAG